MNNTAEKNLDKASNNITILKADKRDIKYINTFLLNQFNRIKRKWIISAQIEQEYKTRYDRKSLKEKIVSIESKNRKIFVAKSLDWKIVWFIDGRYVKDEEEFKINWVVIDEEYKGKWIGWKLFETVIASVKENTQKDIKAIISYHWTNNIPSKRIHKDNLFESEGTEENLYWKWKDWVRNSLSL